MQFGTKALMTLTGKVKDVKLDESGEHARLTFQLGKQNYRGAGKDKDWTNYNATVFGKEAPKLAAKLGEGAIVSFAGDHDQVIREGDKGTRVYNNIRVDGQVCILQDGAAAGPAGVAQVADDDMLF